MNIDTLRTQTWSVVRHWTGLTGHIVTLFILLVLLNILDYQTTIVLIQLTDTSVEANPLLRYAIEATSPTSILWIKAVVLTIAALVFAWAIRHAEGSGKSIRIRRLLNVCLFGACFLYGLLAIHNTYGIYRLVLAI